MSAVAQKEVVSVLFRDMQLVLIREYMINK